MTTIEKREVLCSPRSGALSPQILSGSSASHVARKACSTPKANSACEWECFELRILCRQSLDTLHLREGTV